MQKTRITEKQAQAILMAYALDEKRHILAVPNSTTIFYWECDLLSVTTAHYAHEFEIKRSKADYRADFANKRSKHQSLQHPRINMGGYCNCPNYFWFVTCDLSINPPSYAGWIQLVDTGSNVKMWIKKNAPRLHRGKMREQKLIDIGRICSYRLRDMLQYRFNRRTTK